MAMQSNNTRGAMSDINVTPLVDVMLVLLIIFMVTAPLISQGVEVELPKTKAPALQGDEKKLVLTLMQDKSIYLGSSKQAAIPYPALVERLKSNAKVQKEKELYIHAHRKLEYGFVVDIMARLKEAGIEKIGMVTDPLGE